MADVYSRYETGLRQLVQHLGQEHARFGEALVFQQRLFENIAESRLYGDSEGRKADRARIIAGLNELALAALGLTFIELCSQSEVLPPPTPTAPVGPLPAQPADPNALRRLWRQALAAFYTRNWTRAETLLAQVAAADQTYEDVSAKLADARRWIRLQAFYGTIGELRDDDQWQAVLNALDDLERQQPGYPDPEGLRGWAESRQRYERHYDAALAACERGDWEAAIADLEALLAEFPADTEAQALLEHARDEVARQQRAAMERARRERFGPVLDALQISDFDRALARLEALLKQRPTDREGAELAASLIENPHVPLAQRMRAAALVADDDPRPGLGLENPAYWAQRIEAGSFVMGDDNGKWDDEKPAFICHIRRPYALARYPVTNQQYARFLADLQRQDKDAEAQRRQPRHWSNGTYAAGTGNHPVVCVSWEDASAFAHWADATLRSAGVLGPDEDVRLPAEPEWERAAAYPVVLPGDSSGAWKREYPWGSPHHPTSTLNLAEGELHSDGGEGFLANTEESGIEGTSAVGLFPQGAADCGALDLAGNVWEWCSTPFQGYPLPENLAVDNIGPVQGGIRPCVLRGGAWNLDLSNARCAARSDSPPATWIDSDGLRLARLFSSV